MVNEGAQISWMRVHYAFIPAAKQLCGGWGRREILGLDELKMTIY